MNSMTTDICEIITRHIQKPTYELLDWIDIKKLDFDNLSGNPNAIELLEENPNKIIGIIYHQILQSLNLIMRR